MKKKLKIIIDALSKHLNECDTLSMYEQELHEAYNLAVELMQDAENYERKRNEAAATAITEA